MPLVHVHAWHALLPSCREIKPLVKVLDVLQIEAEGLEAVHVRAAQARGTVLQRYRRRLGAPELLPCPALSSYR